MPWMLTPRDLYRVVIFVRGIFFTDYPSYALPIAIVVLTNGTAAMRPVRINATDYNRHGRRAGSIGECLPARALTNSLRYLV